MDFHTARMDFHSVQMDFQSVQTGDDYRLSS